MEEKLTSLDRCDSCGAQAYVRVNLESGELLFCGHHFKKNEDTLVLKAVSIDSELDKLYPEPKAKTQPEPQVVE
jgi:hypothetical protein